MCRSPFFWGASDFLSTLHFVLNEDLECGTAVRARYSRKVAPAGVAKPRKRGEILFSWSFKFLRKQAL